ncbi:MAG: hypothetical protein HXY42_02180 [Chloroflexi bacterium]|nr:hypothetical protein [Chloroflexota bacterium]
MPEQGDILLVPIPFTDLSSQKRRPVIVDKIYAISKSIVVKTFGRVNEKVMERIRSELQSLTAKK